MSIKKLEAFPVSLFKWIIQESRSLPGAEKWIYNQLDKAQQEVWIQYELEKPKKPLSEVISAWPISEWLLTSRYHSTLAAAWAGSKTVVLDTNLKLRGAAQECQFEALPLSSTPDVIVDSLYKAKSTDKTLLKTKASQAKKAVTSFLADIGI